MLTHLWSRNLEQAQHNGSSLLHDIWGLIKEGLKTGGDSTAGVIRRLTQAGILGLMLAVGICTHTHTHARAHTHTHTHTLWSLPRLLAQSSKNPCNFQRDKNLGLHLHFEHLLF